MSGNEQLLGVSVVLMETRREAILHIATTADRLGYDAFFLPEGWAYDSTVLLAELATCTQRIQLGSGILGIGDALPPPWLWLPQPCMSSQGGASSWGSGPARRSLRRDSTTRRSMPPSPGCAAS